ncbi:tail assembly chaperone [uncultured Limosilactobacillus sp.]|uniref:tail assembly chaperone n=1 Tax=uncultured Limosilactobacillus sp. TaxID=2837629 RepID=UPI0025F9ECE0|nr:tail assembly chaperone [uncultured Limosilactobacillus sp.]
MQVLNINNLAMEPKLNFAFYRQTRDDKELQDENTDGFTNLIQGLVDGNVDMIVATYYHSLAHYKRTQPAEADVEKALEDTIFKSDEATDAAFEDIIKCLNANDFLARKLSEFIKNANKNADVVQDQIEQTDDKERRQTLTIGLKSLQANIDKLKEWMTSTESSSKPAE